MAVWQTRLSGDEPDILATWFTWLRDHLSDQFYIWHQAAPAGMAPPMDLVILHPVAGIWVASVRDWAAADIRSGNGDYVQVGPETTALREAHPIRQAADQAAALRDILERHPHLVIDEGQKAGQLRLAMHHLAILPNVSEADLGEAPLKRLFTADQVIDADLLGMVTERKRTVESVFLEKRNLVYRFANPGGLTPGQLDLIAAILGGEEIAVPDPADYPRPVLEDDAADDESSDAVETEWEPEDVRAFDEPEPGWDEREAEPADTDGDPFTDEGETEPAAVNDDGMSEGRPDAESDSAPERDREIVASSIERDDPAPERGREIVASTFELDDDGEEASPDEPADTDTAPPPRADTPIFRDPDTSAPQSPDAPTDGMAERFAGRLVPRSVGAAMDIAMVETLKYIGDLNDQLLQRMWTRP